MDCKSESATPSPSCMTATPLQRPYPRTPCPHCNTPSPSLQRPHPHCNAPSLSLQCPLTLTAAPPSPHPHPRCNTLALAATPSPLTQHPRAPHNDTAAMDENLFDEWCSAIPEFSNSDRDPDTGNESEDTGERWHWDPHAGMKPSHHDGYASDGEVELVGNLPYGTSIEVNIAMIDLMCELGDDDPYDLDWLPPSKRKKLELLQPV